MNGREPLTHYGDDYLKQMQEMFASLIKATAYPVFTFPSAALHDKTTKETTMRTFPVTPQQLRNVAKSVSGRELTTQQAENYLDIFGDDIERELTDTLRRTVQSHLGKAGK